MTDSKPIVEPCPHGCVGDTMLNGNGDIPWIECEVCGARGPYGRNRSDAIARWNTRAVPDSKPAVTDKAVELAARARLARHLYYRFMSERMCINPTPWDDLAPDSENSAQRLWFALADDAAALLAAAPAMQEWRTPTREEVARLRAKFDWPIAPPAEQAEWVELHWQDHLDFADAILALFSPPQAKDGAGR